MTSNAFSAYHGGQERYWTRERTLAALRHFSARQRGPLPVSCHLYNRLKCGHPEWPPSARVLEHFGTMVDAWQAINASRARYSRAWVPWTQEEDDYLLDHAGEQTLGLIGKRLNRSAGACKRRLYDLGVEGGARHNSGYLSANQVAARYGSPRERVLALIHTGRLRAHRLTGGIVWRVDPVAAEEIRDVLSAPRRVRRRLSAGERLMALRYRDRARFEAAARRAVRALEAQGLVVDLGEGVA